MSGDKIKWHPAFQAAIQLEFKEYKEYLEFSVEHQLTDEPLRIDIVVIKKLKEINIEKSIGKILKKYNVFEYKSPKDYISIDDYYKVKAYAYLYKVLNAKTNEISIEEITMTLVSSRKPKKLIKYLENRQGVKIEKADNGIYYIKGTDIETQLIVTSELDEEEVLYLGLLKTKHDNEIAFKKWMEEYIDNIKNPLYLVIMNILTEASPDDVVEVYKNMGKAQLSDENMNFMLEMMRKLELDKKAKEEGIKEGKINTVKNLLSMGMDDDFIAKATGLDKEKIEDIRKLRDK
ncbi:hypothetical protein [Clostridium felsineum]|uniref:hypothetical protein n=1 Tax=Clostridium felsineum TaxID=36839 RepID=UPI00098C030A|nr:hypothetical protein [Clostridium felsineum]URZ03850.1 hypothetical protein CLAUR_039160 [Clostridium felsineum]